MAGFEVHSVETIGRHYSHTLHKWYDTWMSYKDDILGGKIDAISHHTQGKHLFRLQEFFLAWSVVAAGQASRVAAAGGGGLADCASGFPLYSSLAPGLFCPVAAD